MKEKIIVQALWECDLRTIIEKENVHYRVRVIYTVLLPALL